MRSRSKGGEGGRPPPKRRHVKFDDDDGDGDGGEDEVPALEELAAADAKLDVEEEGTLPLLEVYDDGADPKPSVSSDGDEGDEAPEEVPMRRVKKAARETRRKETEAKSGARKAEKAKRRSLHEKRAKQKLEQNALSASASLPQDLLEELAREQDQARRDRGRSTAQVESAPSQWDEEEEEEEEAGNLRVVVLPSGEGAGFEEPAAVLAGGERESAASFWDRSVAASSGVGWRDSNAAKGAHPQMVVQPRGALYGPHLNFAS